MNSKLTKRNLVVTGVMVAVALVGLVLMQGAPASAEHGVDLASLRGNQLQEATPEAFAGSAMPSLVRILGALAVVLLCVYAGIYGLKRLSGRRGVGGGGRSLEILETTAIAPKKMISLVRVADKAVLVGVTEAGISMLTELTPEKTAELLASRETAEMTEGFPELLKAASGKLREFGLKRKQAALDS